MGVQYESEVIYHNMIKSWKRKNVNNCFAFDSSKCLSTIKKGSITFKRR